MSYFANGSVNFFDAGREGHNAVAFAVGPQRCAIRQLGIFPAVRIFDFDGTARVLDLRSAVRIGRLNLSAIHIQFNFSQTNK